VLIAGGMLPPINEKIYVGYGTGKRCVICQQLVPPTEMEFEITAAVNGSVFCHLPCFNAWKEESVAATKVLSAVEPHRRAHDTA
jgi:hypothetical protein